MNKINILTAYKEICNVERIEINLSRTLVLWKINYGFLSYASCITKKNLTIDFNLVL